MKQRSKFIAVGISIAAIAIGALSFFAVKAPMPSPISVRGGSIHGTTKFYAITWWVSVTDWKEYWTSSSDNDNITISGFGKAPAHLSGTGGWIIKFSNSDGMHLRQADTLLLCSDKECTGQSLDKNNRVYLYAKGQHAYLQPRYFSKALHFHFYDASNSKCDNYPASGNSEDPVCDRIVDITILTNKPLPGTNGDPYTCDAASPDPCKGYVTVGK